MTNFDESPPETPARTHEPHIDRDRARPRSLARSAEARSNHLAEPIPLPGCDRAGDASHLIDYAVGRNRQKRGGGQAPLHLEDDVWAVAETRGEELLASIRLSCGSAK